MSTHRHIDLLCIAAVLLSLVLTVLFCCGQALGIGILTDEDAGDGQFTKNDLNSDWDASGATRITLTGTDGKVSGNGAYISGGDVHIVYAGKYILSGELTDGSVIVDADGDDKIWILLDGVSVHCEDGAALRVEQAKKVFLTLAAGTENTFSDGGTYSEALAESGVDGAVYSRDDLTVNGCGTLTVNGAYRHGIVCNDDFVVTGGTIQVNAVKDGIHANDSVRFAEADLTVSAGDDGITVSNDEGTGYLYIASGRISIPACYEGLEAVSVTIDGGAIDIVPTDDGINASGRGDGSVICINGGTVRIVNPTGRDADGLDSNGDIFINGGEVFISVNGNGSNTAIDYGSENGGVCRISGGTVIACGGNAMLEAIDPDSPQAFLMAALSGAADTALSLTGADGTVLLSAEVPCAFSSVILSTPELQLGDNCTVTVGDTAETVVIDNSSAGVGGMFGGGFGGFGGMHGQGGRGEHGGRDAWAENEDGTPALPEGMEDGEGLPEVPGGGFGENVPEPPADGGPGYGMTGTPGDGGPAEGTPRMPDDGEPEEGMPGTPGNGEPAEGMPGMPGGGGPAEGMPGMLGSEGPDTTRPGTPADGEPGENMPGMPGGGDSGENMSEIPPEGGPAEDIPGTTPGQDNNDGRPEIPAGGESANEMSGMPFEDENGARPSFEGEDGAPEAPPLPDGANGGPGGDLQNGNQPDGDLQDGGFGGFGGRDPDGSMGMDGNRNPDGENGRGTDGGRENRFMDQMQTPGMQQNAPGDNTMVPTLLPRCRLSASRHWFYCWGCCLRPK